MSLAPGDGTILLLGSEKEFSEVKHDYFRKWFRSPPPNRDPATGQYRLDFMPFGIYIGDHTAEFYQQRAAAMGLTIWQWYDRVFKTIRAGGANTIYIQGGGYIERNGELTAKVFADFAAARGFKVIVQPNDAYFGGSCFAGWKTNAGKPDANLGEFFSDYILPRLEQYLPRYRDNRSIFAWCPVEEFPAADEKYFTEYKKLLHTLAPRQLHFQLDSQQNTIEELKSKQPPFPDLFAKDRYCWWLAENGPHLFLWTPHFASRWLYNTIQPYAANVHTLFQGQAICVLQGPAEFTFYGEDSAKAWGWKAEKDFVCPTSTVRYFEKQKRWGGFNRYLPPPNAERLSAWLAVCAGYKGVMLWAALLDGPESVQNLLAQEHPAVNSSAMIGILHGDLTTTPQWNELAATWLQLKKLERLILSMAPSDSAYATSQDPHIFLNSFTDAKGRRYLVVVNGLIGHWDETNPDWLNYPKTKLAVGMDGNLINYTALKEPRKIMLKLTNDSEVYDLRSLRNLKSAP